MLSVVSVGARVSLIAHGSGDGNGGSGGDGVAVSDGDGEARMSAAAAAEAPAVLFAVQDLVLLRSELFLDGGGDGEDGRGVTVKRSARLRMVNVSSVTGDVDIPGVVVDDGAGVGVGVAAGGEVALRTAGEAKLGGAWEPKPFFLGTSLSQMFPSTPPPSDHSHPAGRADGEGDGGGDGGRGSANFWGEEGSGGGCGGGGDGDVDCLTVGGVVVDLAGGSVVRGNVSLAGGAVVQVCDAWG